MQSADRGQQHVGKFENAAAALADPSTTATSSLSRARPPRADELLPWPIGGCERLHSRAPLPWSAAGGIGCHILFAMSRLRATARRAAAILVGATLLAACAEPPTREISQAQGALDAARAAGAEAYARPQFQAADAALKQAHAAVAERDYRQALSFALEAREQARTAAREASAAGAGGHRCSLAIHAAARGRRDRTHAARWSGVTRDQRARVGPSLAASPCNCKKRVSGRRGDYMRAAERTRAIEERLAALTADLSAADPRAGARSRSRPTPGSLRDGRRSARRSECAA